MHEKNRQRIESVDLLKAFAIFCVVWGHSVQNLNHGSEFWYNKVFELIYSFHMPLFFMISGFFFKSSLKQTFKEFIRKKFIQLILPCVIWSVLFMCARCIQHPENINWGAEFQEFLFSIKWSFWFLTELFISYCITYIGYKVLKKDWLVFVCCMAFVLVAPYCGRQRFLFPLFLVGIALKDNYPYIREHLKYFLWGSLLVFLPCLFFWNGDHTIYKSAFPAIFNVQNFNWDFSNIDISLFRLLTGLSGSIFFFTLFHKIHRKNNFCSQISKIGKYTSGIYILQASIPGNYINSLFDFSNTNIWVFNLLITPLFALTVVGICIGIILLVRNKYLRTLLFGYSELT